VTTPDDLRNPDLPLAVRALNRLGSPFRGRVSLEPERLLADARRRTGLSDFGDSGFREPFEILCRALEDEADLHLFGRLLARVQMRDPLVGRLRAEELLKQRPEILGIPVDDPIVILGLPRTGTTILQRLLSRDSKLRSLPYWEALYPLPTRDLLQRPAETATRIRNAERAIQFSHWLSPKLRSMHEMDAEEPDEEIWLLGMDFATMLPEASWNVPSFRHWYERADLRGGYRYLRRMLQILSWYRAGDRWLLKSPQHLEQIPILAETFPRAVFVQTHRDPVSVTTSFASMVAYTRRTSQSHPDPKAIGAYWSDRIETMLRRSAEDRPPVIADRFVDVQFRDLNEDPVAVVRRIYEVADRELTPAAEAAMRAFLAANPRGKHGSHDYRLEDFGLDLAERRRALAFYCERFGVPAET
jgi:hypothetical protein